MTAGWTSYIPRKILSKHRKENMYKARPKKEQETDTHLSNNSSELARRYLQALQLQLPDLGDLRFFLEVVGA